MDNSLIYISTGPVSYIRSLLLLLVLSIATPILLQAQEIKDLPLTVVEMQQFTGYYSITMQGSNHPVMRIRFFETDGNLMGQIDSNDPTRLLYQGNHILRPEAAPDWKITFPLDNGQATQFSIESPDGNMEGVRITEKESSDESGDLSDRLRSGRLFDELVRMDSLLFDAAFVSCNTEIRNSMFTDDIEFYHDLIGFQSAQEVRAPIENCPRDNGVIRQLVDSSLEVYPIKDFGAVQMGVHHFVEDGASGITVAKFVHLWQKAEGEWKVSRILSIDHHSVELAADIDGE